MKMSRMLILAFLAHASAGLSPEQVRIGLGYSPASMHVAWATMENTSAPVAETNVQWGISASKLDATAKGEAVVFTSDPNRNFTTHMAVMSSLKPSSKYFYRVGGPTSGWSQVFSFKSQADATTLTGQLPQVHVLLGDMGSAFAYSLCPDCTKEERCICTNTSAGVISETPDMILHTGDFAYDMDTNGGTTADNFFRNIEPVASAFPYMVSHGNHEDGDVSLARYTESFRHMPNNSAFSPSVKSINGLAPNNWFFSWDSGLVHYVSISTEIQGGAMLARGGNQLIADQFKFLEADLIAANKNRHAVPWIIVNGHRSMYCSCDGDCDAEAEQQRLGPWSNGTYGFEKLLFEQGVDLFVNGHEHNYERMWPTYQNKTTQSNVEPKAPIYIVTGAAGCKELHEPFTRPQPPRSAFRSNTFGYSKMTIFNHTHIRWQQIMTDPTFFGPDKYGKVIDDTMIIQSKHGPFDVKEAPKSYFGADGASIPSVSIDHWEGLQHPDAGIRMPEGTTWKENKNVIANASMSDFLKEFGDSIWEDNHDSYHVTVAALMKQIAKESNPAVIVALEKELQDFAANQA